MQITFKSPGSQSEQKVDISLDSTVAETRSAVQMLLGLPESDSFKFFLERTNTVLSDDLTFREANVQEGDKVSLVPLDFKAATSNTNNNKTDFKERSKDNRKGSKDIPWKTVILCSTGIAAFIIAGGAYTVNSERLRGEEQQRIETERQLAEAQEELEMERQLAEEMETERQLSDAQELLKREQSERQALQRQLEQGNRSSSNSSSRTTSNSSTSSSGANATIVSTDPGSKNIRSGPGTSYGVKHIAYPGDCVLIRSSSQDSGGYTWHQIYFPESGADGWIAGQLLQRD